MKAIASATPSKSVSRALNEDVRKNRNTAFAKLCLEASTLPGGYSHLTSTPHYLPSNARVELPAFEFIEY